MLCLSLFNPMGFFKNAHSFIINGSNDNEISMVFSSQPGDCKSKWKANATSRQTLCHDKTAKSIFIFLFFSFFFHLFYFIFILVSNPNNLKAINISVDIKSSMFPHTLNQLSIDNYLLFLSTKDCLSYLYFQYKGTTICRTIDSSIWSSVLVYRTSQLSVSSHL